VAGGSEKQTEGIVLGFGLHQYGALVAAGLLGSLPMLAWMTALAVRTDHVDLHIPPGPVRVILGVVSMTIMTFVLFVAPPLVPADRGRTEGGWPCVTAQYARAEASHHLDGSSGEAAESTELRNRLFG